MERARMEEIKRLGGKLEALEEVLKMLDERCCELFDEIYHYDNMYLQARREGDIESAKDYEEQANKKLAIKRELTTLMVRFELEIEDVKGEM